jgi:large subunit ribosomal protein L9
MEVILLEHVEKLGGVGDAVVVKDGYARNYLLPQGKALRATNENKAVFESKRAEIEAENNKKKADAEAKAAKIDGNFVILIRQAGEDGRLYGSANARDIANTIAEQEGIELGRNQVVLSSSIKYLGVHPVKVYLHPEVAVTVNANISRSEEEAEDAKQEFLNPKPKEDDVVPANDDEIKGEAATSEQEEEPSEGAQAEVSEDAEPSEA